MEAVEWRNELERLQRLLAKQQQQMEVLQKQLGVPADDDAEEVDVPAAEYRRAFLVVTLIQFTASAYWLIVAFASLGGVEGNWAQVGLVFWPMLWTFAFALVVGTMDSSVAGRHALLLYRGWLGSCAVIYPIGYWAGGQRGHAVFIFGMFVVNTIYWSWLGHLVVETLRKKGNLATQADHYVRRFLKVLGFQILLAITALSQGVNGSESFARVYATFIFSSTLTNVWMYTIVIFDICRVDGRAAAKLRTSPLQTAALASCGIFLLFGLAGYILAGQRKPSPKAARALFYLLVNSGFITMAFIGRLAALARRGLDKPPASSVKPVDALGSLDLPGA